MMILMTTCEKLERQLRVNHRQKKQRKKATKVRRKTNVIASTLRRTSAQATRLTRVVNVGGLLSARKENDKKLCLTPPGEIGKYRTPVSNRRVKRIGKHKFSMKALRHAISEVEKDIDKVPIFTHFVRRAYHDDTVLKALMSKLLPDLKSVDAKVTQESPFRLIIDLSDRPQLPMLNAQGILDDEDI